MRIVFLNSLEKKQGDEVSCHAQVWIAEDEGVWRMGWNESEADEELESIWYEGASWSEMLHTYRYELAGKLSAGFYPIMEGLWNEKELSKGGRLYVQKLHYYAEMNPNSSVFTELSSWRRKKATSEHKVPYLIANNRLLSLLSVFLPQNEEELLQIPGMGISKVKEFGSELVGILRIYERATAFPLDWVEEQIEEESFRTWAYKQKEIKFKSEKLRYTLRQNILQGIEEGLDIGQLSANTNMDRRDFVRQLEELEKMGCSVEKLIVTELSDMTKEEQQMVWSLYEELGDAFLKPVLQRIYGAQLEGVPEGLALETLYERLRLIRIRYRRKESTNR